jgi:hypothetical protein
LLRWADNAIANRWLRVTIKATPNTALENDEVYYIGHLRGETTGPSGSLYSVTVADAINIANAVGTGLVDSGNPHDIDKNGLVTINDIVSMVGMIGSNTLRNITIPAAGSPNRMFGGGSFDGNRNINGLTTFGNHSRTIPIVLQEQPELSSNLSDEKATRFSYPWDHPTTPRPLDTFFSQYSNNQPTFPGLEKTC